jgi:hypothetical protein
MKLRPLLSLLVLLAVGASPALVYALAPTDPDAAALFDTTRLSTAQQTGGTATLPTSSASVGADVLRGATGNVGVNVAAGALNVQANQIALAASPAADIETRQDAHASASITGSGHATLGAGALSHASGNIGLNLVSGAANAQSNALVIH